MRRSVLRTLRHVLVQLAYQGGTLAHAPAAGGDVIGDVVVGDSGDDVTELCGDV